MAEVVQLRFHQADSVPLVLKTMFQPVLFRLQGFFRGGTVIANTKKCVQRHPQCRTDTSCGIKGRGFGRMGEEIINGGEGDAGRIGNVLGRHAQRVLFFSA